MLTFTTEVCHSLLWTLVRLEITTSFMSGLFQIKNMKFYLREGEKLLFLAT